MCGIAGFIDCQINYNIEEVSYKMGEAIKARGPDSYGFWQDNNQLGVNLIHRRLSILDLSDAGHQPMRSHSSRYVIVFNGEIYNFKQLARDLENKLGPISWRGHSDTEVILMAIEAYGFEFTIELLEGMFAIALWDQKEQKLYLARDRMGEKPLYYGYFNGVFGFASELKALHQHPKFQPTINKNAISQLMMHNCIPAPYSIFDNIYKLNPGSFLVLSYHDYLHQVLPENQAYWKLSDNILLKYQDYSSHEAVQMLDTLLNDVVSKQMVADVNVGCFLSGGIDSSTIAAIMQNQSKKPIETFSIGFDVPEYNEAEFAKAIASHIGSNHHELYVTQKDALNVVTKLPSVYDEPFSDSSQIPTYLLCDMVSRHVKVALTGDGGDELFCGYKRYSQTLEFYNKFNNVPIAIKSMASKLVSPFKNISKLNKLKVLLNSDNFTDFYINNISHWLDIKDLVKDSFLEKSLWAKDTSMLDNNQLIMQYLDILGYLPDDNLVKVDRASMFHSLETRVPLLSHRIVEFAMSIPMQFKVQNQEQKWILKQLLYKYVPYELLNRPKKGFSVPLGLWLRGELKDWAASLLDPTKLKQQGFFNEKLISKKFMDHISGKANNEYYLWDVLMFQQWLECYTKGTHI